MYYYRQMLYYALAQIIEEEHFRFSLLTTEFWRYFMICSFHFPQGP